MVKEYTCPVPIEEILGISVGWGVSTGSFKEGCYAHVSTNHFEDIADAWSVPFFLKN